MVFVSIRLVGFYSGFDFIVCCIWMRTKYREGVLVTVGGRREGSSRGVFYFFIFYSKFVGLFDLVCWFWSVCAILSRCVLLSGLLSTFDFRAESSDAKWILCTQRSIVERAKKTPSQKLFYGSYLVPRVRTLGIVA